MSAPPEVFVIVNGHGEPVSSHVSKVAACWRRASGSGEEHTVQRYVLEGASVDRDRITRLLRGIAGALGVGKGERCAESPESVHLLTAVYEAGLAKEFESIRDGGE